MKYKNKYRIETTRATWWDYGSNALYFVTICCHNRFCYFGHVLDAKMILSDIGEIAKYEWLKTFDMRPDMNLYMGEYVVMPNHFHAVIGIGANPYNTPRDTQPDTQRRDAMHCVSTDGGTIPKNKFGPQSKNLASIVRGFKIGVTTNARKINPDFQWQARYHDHIIRNEESFSNISHYIKDNPSKWELDKFFNT